MNRQTRSHISLLLCALMLATGCKPTQPFFFSEDGKPFGPGDLSHYLDVATEIEYPNVCVPSLDEVSGAQSPLTLANAEDFEMWDLTLEEVTRYTLANSQVIRQLGGRIVDSQNIAVSSPETITQNAAVAVTTYDPALVESGSGTATGSPLSGTGVEAALSEFDATLDSSITFQKNDRPQNFAGAADTLFATNFLQDLSNATTGITKNTADGTTFEVRNNTIYDNNNNGARATPADWVTNFEAAFSRPLLQGAGTEYNRIAGPQSFQQSAANIVNQIDGVMISRIRNDIALTDFEGAVRDLMRDVEDTYWELYFAYRDVEAQKVGRDSALETWRKVKTLQRVGGQGGAADQEAQARSQYFLFRAQVESRLTILFRLENKLRYMMGLQATDGRLIRPIDEPTVAKVQHDWASIHCEALARRTELRAQRWLVKRRELELIAAKNHLLPRLDATGRYRFLGAGEDLINSSRNGIKPYADGSNAYDVLTSGDYQEWQVGVQFTMPIGFRKALSGVRHHQLLLARDRAVLQDLELEVSHQLSDAVRDVDLNHQLTQTNFSRLVAAVDEVEAVTETYEVGRVTFDLLLDTQRRRAEAESAYYRSLADYNRSIMRVHWRKGSLLEYNGVYLTEGPWPSKAYFDALRRARQRDASTYMDYGITQPRVISRGPYDQQQMGNQGVIGGEPIPAGGPVFDDSQEGTPKETISPLPDSEPLPADQSSPLTQLPTPTDNLSAAAGLQTNEDQNPLRLASYLEREEPDELAPIPDSAWTDPKGPTLHNWMEDSTRSQPKNPNQGNPFRAAIPLPAPGEANAARIPPVNVDESQTHNTTPTAAPDAPVWARP